MEVKNYRKLLVSEILSKSFNILKSNALEILKVAGIYIIPATIVMFGVVFGIIITSFFRSFFMASYLEVEQILGIVGFGSLFLIFVIGIIFSLILVYADCIIIKIIDDSNKGNQVSFKSANSYVWERKWRIIGINILVYLMLICAIVIITFLTVLISLLTLGVGLAILIPVIIAIWIILIPLKPAFNSMLIVNDMKITESIKETFLLFRNGHFWSTVGYFSAISGILIGIGILLGLSSYIPFLGFFISTIGQFIIQIYLFAYITVYVSNRNRSFEDNYYTNFNGHGNNGYYDQNNYRNTNNDLNSYSDVNNNYDGSNINNDNLISSENNNEVEGADNIFGENNDNKDE